MTISNHTTFKTMLAATATAILIVPTAQAEIGVSVGASVGGHGDRGGIDAGVGANVGGHGGVGVGADVSIGGDHGDSGGSSGSGGSGGSTGSGGSGGSVGVGVGVGNGGSGSGSGTGGSSGGSGNGGSSGGSGSGGSGGSSNSGGNGGTAAGGTSGATAGVSAGVSLGGGNDAATRSSVNLAAMVGAPVWSKDRSLIGMVERVTPGPAGKVDAVVRLNAALPTQMQTVQMRVLPRLTDKGALLLGYSKRQFLELFSG